SSQKVYKKDCDCVNSFRLLASASFRQYAVNKDFVFYASRRKVLELFNESPACFSPLVNEGQ
ncbi:MAG: hypothetical protein Q8910_19315, partial [Bacteroidota bacterium]|nr:hypothetical protein [Bacteroidota bacterium]